MVKVRIRAIRCTDTGVIPIWLNYGGDRVNYKWKKQFAIIFTGQAFSILGSQAVQFAIIWWLTVQTESAVTLTTAALIGFIPSIVLGPYAGVWVDRLNRKTIMILADGLVAVSSGILGIAFLITQSPPLWFVYLILFLRGLGSTFHSPAMQAAIPMLVPPDMLTKAGGWAKHGEYIRKHDWACCRRCFDEFIKPFKYYAC